MASISPETSSSKASLWVCCVCLKASRHTNSVQCDACLACAHCKCAGFRTYAEAEESNALFFCRACDLLRKNHKPRPSPIRTPLTSPLTVRGISSTSAASPTLANSALSPLANSTLSRSRYASPVRASATQPPGVSPSNSIFVTPNGRIDSPTQPPGVSPFEVRH